MSMIKNVRFGMVEKPYRRRRHLTFWGKLLVGIVLLGTVVLLVGARSVAPAERVLAENIVPPPTMRVEYVKHLVLSGECMSTIAEKYRGQWCCYAPLEIVEESIRQYNAKKLLNGYLLQAGSVLYVPIWIIEDGE